MPFGSQAFLYHNTSPPWRSVYADTLKPPEVVNDKFNLEMYRRYGSPYCDNSTSHTSNMVRRSITILSQNKYGVNTKRRTKKTKHEESTNRAIQFPKARRGCRVFSKIARQYSLFQDFYGHCHIGTRRRCAAWLVSSFC